MADTNHVKGADAHVREHGVFDVETSLLFVGFQHVTWCLVVCDGGDVADDVVQRASESTSTRFKDSPRLAVQGRNGE